MKLKRKKKLENLRKLKEEKELKSVTYYPETNKEKNSKFKLNPKNYTAVERLYTQDLIKRKEKKQILTKIYTPSFKPKLYTNKIVNGKNNNNKNKNLKEESDYYTTDEKKYSEEEDNDNYELNNNIEKNYENGKNYKIYEDVRIENKLRNLLFKNNKKNEKRNKSVEKRKKIKFNLD